MRFWEYQRATDYYQQKAARLKPQQPTPAPAPAQDITPYQPSSPAPQPQAGNSALPAWAAQPFAQQQTAPTNQFGLTQYTTPTPLEQQNLYGPQLVAQEQAVQQQMGYDPYNSWLNREGRLTPGSALMGLMNVGTQYVGAPLLGALTAAIAPGQQVDTSGGLADIYKQWQAIEHARAPAFNIPAGPLNINEKWISENFLADPFFWTGIGATAMAGKAATAGAKAAELGGEATEAGLKMLQQAARWKKAADVVQTAENITSPLSWPGTAGRGLRALSQGGGILQDLGEESAEQFARSGARIPNLTREALLTMPAAQRAMALSGIDEQLAASAPYALGGNLPLWAVNKMAESPALRTAADVAGRGLGALGFATTIQPRIAQAGVTGAMGLVQGLSGGIPKMLGREIPQELIDRLGPEAAEAAWRRAGLGQIVSSPFKAVGGSLVGELGDITGLDRLRARTAANQVGREALGAEAGAADLGALAPTPAEEERRLAAARAAGGFLWKNAKPQFKGMTVGIMPPDIDDGALTSDFANPLQKTRIKPYDWAWVDKNGNWATLDENGQRRELLTRGDEDTAGAAAGEEIGRLRDEYAAKQQAQPAVATEASVPAEPIGAGALKKNGRLRDTKTGLTYTITKLIQPPGGNVALIEVKDRFGHTERIKADEIGSRYAPVGEEAFAPAPAPATPEVAAPVAEPAPKTLIPTVLYHGTKAEYPAGEITTGQRMYGIHLTTDQEAAGLYGNVRAYSLSGNSKVLDLSDGERLWDWMKNNGILGEEDATNADLQQYTVDGRLFQYDVSSRTSFADDVAKTARYLGYDAVILPDDLGGRGGDITWVVVNPKKLQSPAPVAEPAVRPEEAPAAGTLLGAQLDSPEAINATEGLRYAPELRSEGEWRNGTILLGPRFLKLTAESKTGVLAHERAHGVEDTLSDTRIAEVIELAKQNVWGPYDAERAVINGINGEYKPLENFTEAVAMLGLDPLWLKSKYPQATEYVLRVLREDQHPLPAQAVEKLGLQIPADYVREGDQYVYRPAETGEPSIKARLEQSAYKGPTEFESRPYATLLARIERARDLAQYERVYQLAISALDSGLISEAEAQRLISKNTWYRGELDYLRGQAKPSAVPRPERGGMTEAEIADELGALGAGRPTEAPPAAVAPAAPAIEEPAVRPDEVEEVAPAAETVAPPTPVVAEAAPRVETPVAAPDEQITTTRQVRVERTGDTVSLAYGIRDLGSFKLGEWPTDEAAQKTFLSTLMGSPRDQRLWGDRAEIDALVKRGLTAQGVPVAALEGLPVATVAPEPEAPKPVGAEAPAPKPEAPTAKPPRSANTTYNTAAVLNGDVMTLTYKERSRNIRADKWPSEYKEQLRTMRELFQGMTVPPDALADLRKRANSVLKKAATPPPAPPAAPQPAAPVAPPAPPAAAVPPTGTTGQPPLPGAGRVPPSTTPPTAGILPPAAPTAPRPQPVAAPTTGERVFADKKELSDAIAELSPSVRKSIGETAVKTRDLYTEMGPAQADAVVQRVLKYGDIGKLFEADDMGRAWVKRNGATARERVALDDVLQNPSQFDLSGKQEEVTRAFGPIYRDAMRVLKEYGVKTADRTKPDPDNPDLPPLEQFIARRTIGFYNPDTGKFDMFQQFPDGKIHPVMPASFQRRRFYNTKEEAIADGGVYMKPEEALRGYITQMYRKVGDVMMGEYLIKNLVPIHEKAQGADVEFRIPGLMGKGYDQHNKDVAIIEKALGMTGVDKFKVLGQIVAQANDIPRMMLATFDVSPALLQGQILLAYNPRVWLRSVGLGIANFFDKGKGWQQFMDAHKETVRKIANYGPQLGSVESSVGVQESGLLTGRKFQGDGVLKRATRKFGENYDRTLTASRVLMAESLMRDTMSEKEKYDVMSFINEMTGTVSYARTNATETQRVWENALLFSPRYTRATLALLSDVARGGIKGKLARQALGKWAAAGLLLYLAICKALGQEPNLDPREGGKWLTFEVAGNNIGIGGAVYSTLRTGGKMAAEVLTGQPGEAVATLRKYLLSRGSPITSTMYKFLMREDYIGKPLDTLPELTRDWLKTNMVPTWLQATLEQGAIGDPNAQKGEGTVAMLTGLTGLRSYPVSAATARNAAREEYAQEWYGKKYDDLSAVEKARINSEAPGMAEKVQAAQQVGIEHRNPYSMFWDDVANVRQKYEDEIGLLTSQLENGQLSGNAYREAVQQRELLRAKVPEQLKQTAQYRGKVEDYAEEEPTTPVDRFINEYYDIPTKYTDPATGVGDAAKIVKARELLKQAYDTEVVDEAMAFINRNRSPEYVEAQKQWAEYQAIPQYLGMTRAQQDAANRASTTIRSWRRQNPYVSAAATKAAYARYDPEGYRLYVMSSKLGNPARRRYFAAHPLLSKYYGDVEGEVLEANPYA